jgi:hypothetical protein
MQIINEYYCTQIEQIDVELMMEHSGLSTNRMKIIKHVGTFLNKNKHSPIKVIIDRKEEGLAKRREKCTCMLSLSMTDHFSLFVVLKSSKMPGGKPALIHCGYAEIEIFLNCSSLKDIQRYNIEIGEKYPKLKVQDEIKWVKQAQFQRKALLDR